MQILITGGAGFLGARLAEELILIKQKVALLVRKEDNLWRLKDLEKNIQIYFSGKETGKVFKKFKPETVIHLATDFGRQNYDPIKMLETNILFPTKLLELCVEYNCRKFINSSTCLPSDYNLYAASKNAFLEIAGYYANNKNIKFIDVVLGYMYGEKDDKSKFIPHVIDSIFKGKNIKATGGEQSRDFVYVGDVSRKIAELTQKDPSAEKFMRYRISSGKYLTIKEIISSLEKISGIKAKVKWGALAYKSNEVFDVKNFEKIPVIPECKKADTLLGSGLKKTLDWYSFEQSKPCRPRGRR